MKVIYSCLPALVPTCNSSSKSLIQATEVLKTHELTIETLSHVVRRITTIQHLPHSTENQVHPRPNRKWFSAKS